MLRASGEPGDAFYDEIRAYEASVLEAIKRLTAGMRRAAALVHGLDEPGADPELHGMAVAECQSWRTILERVPGESPPVYRNVHARVVRWSAVVAELGDLQVAALASGSAEAQERVGQMAVQVAERYRDIVVAMEQVAAAQRTEDDVRI